MPDEQRCESCKRREEGTESIATNESGHAWVVLDSMMRFVEDHRGAIANQPGKELRSSSVSERFVAEEKGIRGETESATA